MIITISKQELIKLIAKQLNNLLVFEEAKELPLLAEAVDKALEKTEFCFGHISNKYYSQDGETCFHPFHTGQYTIFLYFLSRILFHQYHNVGLAEKVFYLNKILNSVDLYYEVMLPDVFFLDHPLGSVMGRAKYSNFFAFSHRCTIGNNKDKYPVLNEGVTLMSGVTIIGDSIIGKNCIVAANTYIKDQNIPDNSLVFGASPNLTIKERKKTCDNEYSFFKKISNHHEAIAT